MLFVIGWEDARVRLALVEAFRREAARCINDIDRRIWERVADDMEAAVLDPTR